MENLDNKNLEVVNNNNNDNIDVSKWLSYKNNEVQTVNPNKQPQLQLSLIHI